jgi:hypothetical protein
VVTDLWQRNRRVMARRAGWPAGALAECERLDVEHPGWRFYWFTENRITGWERPAGFAARLPSAGLAGADELRRLPEDNVCRDPHVFGPDVATVVRKIGFVEQQVAERDASRERLSAWSLATRR